MAENPIIFSIDKDKVASITNMLGTVGVWICDRVGHLMTYEVKKDVQIEAPVDTGRLSTTIEGPTKIGIGTYGLKFTVPYWKFVWKGTGIYGPKGMPIVPKHGKFLVFNWSKSVGDFRLTKLVFLKSVKGIKPNKFVERGMATAQTQIDGIISIACREALEHAKRT